MVGNMVQGVRLAVAQGRDIGIIDEDSDTARKYQFISEILRWRATTTADHAVFTLLNAKVGASSLPAASGATLPLSCVLSACNTGGEGIEDGRKTVQERQVA